MSRKTRRWALGAAGTASAATLALGQLTAVNAQQAGRSALLVLNKKENALVILDPETLKVTGKVPTGDAPHELVASADGKTVFVANYGEQQPGNTLSVIDVAARKEVRRVDLGPLWRPHGLVEAGGKIYFTAEGAAAVARYDPTSNRVDWIMGTGQAATHMLAISPEQDRLYTVNILSSTVSVVSLQAPPGAPAVTQIPVAKQPEGIALSPDGKQLWVGHHGEGGITIINTLTDRVVRTVKMDGLPIRLQFTPDGKRVLVSDAPAGELVVLEADTGRELRRVEVGPVPVGLVVSPDGKRAYVSLAMDRKVAVVDLEKLVVTATPETGENPDGIALAYAKPVRAPRKPGALGVAVAPISEEVRQAEKLQTPDGVVVVQVGEGSPAAAAGLEPGDVILALNGMRIVGTTDFVRLVFRSNAGDVLEFEVVRKGEKAARKATLAERPGSPG